MRKSLWIMLAVMVVALSAPNAHADSVTLDVSGSLTPEVGASCSPSPCTLGGDIVINNTTGALISADVTLAGALPPVGKFTANSFSVPVVFMGFTFIGFNDPTFIYDLALVFATPTAGSLVGYGGGPLTGVISPGVIGSDVCEGPQVGASVCSGGVFVLTSGSLTPAVVTPEPSPLALMLLGVGVVFLLRKRNSRCHQLAA